MRGIKFVIVSFLTSMFIVLNFSTAFALNTDIIKDSSQIEEANKIDDFGDGVQSEDVNPLVDVLCQVVVFMQARTGRAIALAALFAMGIMFFLGKVTWPQIVIFGIGLGILFGAKSIALLVLPYYLDDSGGLPIATSTAISNVCPEI